MRILMVHKYFHCQGVSTSYMFNLSGEMERHGHKVIHFAMQDPRNEPSPYSFYFAKPIDFNVPGSVLQDFKKIAHALYSFDARRHVERLIEAAHPEAVFLHTIYNHLTPSILLAFKRFGLPVVQHLQDYFLICPNYKLFANGKLCERCRGGRFYNAILQACCMGSLKRSAAQALVTAIHRVLKAYENNIDFFIAPSEFLKKKYLEFGFKGNIIHIPQAISLEGREPCYESENYIVYFGWLKPEKGVATLIKSMAKVPHTRLLVIGDGEDRERLERIAYFLGLNNVNFTGIKLGQDLLDTIRHARFVVVPSEWYEVFGMVTYEAFALGKPVIGSRIGATPELVHDGETGLLFNPGDSDDLAEKIIYMLGHPHLVTEMGHNARAMVEGKFSTENNYRSIMKLYEDYYAR